MRFTDMERSDVEIAFELLFRKYYLRLCGFATRFVSDTIEAEEIVQEVFVKIWNKREQLKLDDKLKPYLFKSVQNLCYNFLEHKKVVDDYHAVLAIVYENQAEEFSAYETVLFNEFQKRVDEAISTLPEQCRIIFEFSRKEGLKYSEIAEKLNISIKTVETQMSRALARLKIELKDYLSILLISLLLNS
jgi:RNA polymerase sigma-70 factor, ECF subfamily